MRALTTVALSEIAAINPTLPTRPPEDTAISFLRMPDVDETLGTTTAGVSQSFGEAANGHTLFRAEDLLVAKITPCFENGKIAAPQIATAVGVGSTEFHVVRPDTTRVDRGFLLHFLRSGPVRALGELRMTGSAGQRRVPKAFLTSLRVPLPVLREQRRIARALDLATAVRRKRATTVALRDDFATELFIEWFGDPGTNPRRLPTAYLGEVGGLDRGVSKHRPRNAPELLGGPYPLIQTGDVTRAGDRIRRWSATYSEAGLEQSRMWPAGTLCITIAANIADAAILEFDACFPDSVVGFVSDPATTEYVRVWLGLRQRAIEAAAPESAQKNINLEILRNMALPVPPQSVREDFRRAVSTSARVADGHRVHLHHLDALFASLQHRAFAGEL